jgi:hypothetical protein
MLGELSTTKQCTLHLRSEVTCIQQRCILRCWKGTYDIAASQIAACIARHPDLQRYQYLRLDFLWAAETYNRALELTWLSHATYKNH